MTLEQENRIAAGMKKYKESEFKLYLDETGWEEWMYDFLSDGEPTGSDFAKIEKIQKDIWFVVFS